METRKINEDYRKIALHLIDTEAELSYIKDSSVRVVFLESDLAKKADKENWCSLTQKAWDGRRR